MSSLLRAASSVFLVSAFSIVSSAQTPAGTASATAPGCGEKQIKWDVTTDRSKHPVVSPEPGKSVIYFLQDDSYFQSRPRPTTRFGLNGAWVGATQSNAYFYVAVDPGEIHVCADWQSFVVMNAARTTAASHFTAEAGKSYFFLVRNRAINNNQHGPDEPADLKLEQIDSDEAQLLMSKFGFSSSHPRK